MDTTNFLIHLIKKEIGLPPNVSDTDLEPIQNYITIYNPELVLHLAASFNEPVIVNYVLDRYDLNPNPPNVSLDPDPDDTYTNVLLFNCIDVLHVFIERKLFPNNWYRFFLFTQLNNNNTVIDEVLENYNSFIKLSHEQALKLYNLTLNTNIKNYLKPLLGEPKV